MSFLSKPAARTRVNIIGRNLAMSGKSIKSKLTQSSKSTSSLPHREFPAATSTFSGLAIILSAFLGFLGVSNTYATSSISISLSGNVSLNLLKDNSQPVFGTSTVATANVTSDHYTGYTLTIAGSNDTGRLVSSNDSSKYLSSIDSAINENTFRIDSNYNDKWGFLPSKYNSLDNTYYQPSPTTTATTIDVTNSPNPSGTNYTLALGAKVTPNMALDSYGQTFVLAATGNGYDYHIGFTDNLATLPDDIYGNSPQSNQVALPNTSPTKEGYTFGGWCSEETTADIITGTVCPAGADVYQPGQNVTLQGDSANNMLLYAIWTPVTFDTAYSNAGKSKDSGYYKMQDMTTDICKSVAVGQESTLIDKRTGNKTYKVGKMKDGHCWMLDNLALGGTSTIALTPDNTNIKANWTLSASVSTDFNNSAVSRINTGYINTLPSDPMSSAGGWRVGTYYNYCAATAGTYCPTDGTAGIVSTQDICPKGWRMPSGGYGGEYQAFSDAYGDNYTNVRNALHLPFSGYYHGSQTIDQGNGGRWWSNTVHTVDLVYTLNINSAGYFPQGDTYRSDGFSMRCLAK